MTRQESCFPAAGDLPAGVRFMGELRARMPADIGDAAIADALDSPLWPDHARRTLEDIVAPSESVCIVVSDYTRKTAADRVLPILVDRLVAAGCRAADISLLIATGIHRPPTEGEIDTIVGRNLPGEIRRRVVVHDPDDESGLREVGTTGRGHPVRVHRLAAEADRLLLTGAATYHYHAGFGGGRKSLVPGVASRDTIAFNHSLTLDPGQDRVHPCAAPGILDGNPVAQEMREGARLCSPDMIVNTVVGPDGRLAAVFAGELDLAHRQACRAVESFFRVDLGEQADIVIADASGAPNWIQAHKGLFNAHRALTDNGTLILVAPCPEGIGNDRFPHWVSLPEISHIYAELRQSPEILGQTALSTRLRGVRTILVSGMAEAQTLGMRTADSLGEAISAAVREQQEAGRSNPSVWLMPEARYTVPFPGTYTARPACLTT